jgi:hypothetical protein
VERETEGMETQGTAFRHEDEVLTTSLALVSGAVAAGSIGGAWRSRESVGAA